MTDVLVVPITRLRCPNCGGSGKSSEHFAQPFQIKNDHGDWIVSPYCPMCYGHGVVLVKPLLSSQEPK